MKAKLQTSFLKVQKIGLKNNMKKTFAFVKLQVKTTAYIELGEGEDPQDIKNRLTDVYVADVNGDKQDWGGVISDVEVVKVEEKEVVA
jgi:hypothetical protein